MTPPPLPGRMARLERDDRGFPIPWNVYRDRDDKAHFIVNDHRRAQTALLMNMCPICGQLNDRAKWFVGGPRSAFDPNGWYFDLPGHHECIQYALQVCPWLAAARYLRRTDELRAKYIKAEMIATDDTQDPNRPVLFVALASVQVEVAYLDKERFHVRPRKPYLGVEYWQHGSQLDAATGEKLVREVIGKHWQPPQVASSAN